MSRVILLSVLACYLVAAQTTKIDLQNQSRGVDFSAAPYTKPVKTGTALSPTCSIGEAYVLTTAVPGANLFICTATNTWTLQAGQTGPAGPQGPVGPQGPAGPAGGGVSDHSQLTHLDYASSGHTGFQPALGYTPINASTLAQPNGPAKLGSDGKILASELPPSASGLAVAFSTEQAAADGVQYAFTLAGSPLSGSLTVTVNGQVQEPGSLADYTFNGSTVTFAAGSTPQSGNRISFRYAISTGSGTANVAFATDTATGDVAQSAFNLSNTPLSGSLTVAVNGQVQEAGSDYSLTSSTVVTFYSSSVPTTGARISFRYGYAINGGGTGGQILMSQLPAGIPNGLATLGSDGKVLAAQLPATQSSGNGGGGMQSFTTAGATTWTVPSGVTRVFVQAWAGGGGGTASYYGAGSGGGGGGYAEGWCVVTPGATPAVTVGAGGAGSVGSAAAGAGGDSSFASCLRAIGGGGTDLAHSFYPGKNAVMPNGYFMNSTSGNPFFPYATLAGAGCASCFPSRNDQGGIGGYGPGHNSAGTLGSITYYGGGGGGSGADNDSKQIITPLAGGAGGASSFGGNGGSGGTVTSGIASACTPGTAPSGGGGGSAWDGTNVANGCAGARGQVTLWW